VRIVIKMNISVTHKCHVILKDNTSANVQKKDPVRSNLKGFSDLPAAFL